MSYSWNCSCYDWKGCIFCELKFGICAGKFLEAGWEKEGPKLDCFPSFVVVTLAKIALITCLDVNSSMWGWFEQKFWALNGEIVVCFKIC